MPDAVIVSTARTGIGKAYRGAFNNTHGATVAGGLESISLVQNEHQNKYRLREPWLAEHKPEIYMTMIETAEVVAKRYFITREQQDEYALASQQRTAAAQREGRF